MSAPDSSRWLVTINGIAPTYGDMAVHRQTMLASLIASHSTGGTHVGARAAFHSRRDADHFLFLASREFPEDDVRLWTSVDPSSKER